MSQSDLRQRVTMLRAVSATDPGRVRPTNQDMALVAGELVAVADGMGGHAGGEVAAATAVAALQEAFSSNPTLAGLIAATEQANKVVFDKSEREAELHGMGTTLTAAALVPSHDGGTIGVVNVGDSRAYILESGQLNQLTDDHSLVEEMVRQGEITPSEAAVHPHRHILTRALGIDPGVDVDSWELHPQVGMRILLCSDGLTNECTDDEIAAILIENADLERAAQTLVERAINHGGSDNITVVVADVDIEVGDEADKQDTSTRQITGSKATTPDQTNMTASPSGSAMTTASLPVQTARRLRSARPARGARSPSATYIPNEPLITPRVLLFFVALFLVIGGAFGFIVWFNKASYYVGIDSGTVAIYNGRPNGLFWMHPTLVEKTALQTNQIFPSTVTMLRGGILEASFVDAKRVVNDLTGENVSLGFPTTTTSSTPIVSTSTTKAAH